LDIEKCRGVDIDKSEVHMMDVKECVTAAGATKFEDLEAEKMAVSHNFFYLKKTSYLSKFKKIDS